MQLHGIILQGAPPNSPIVSQLSNALTPLMQAVWAGILFIGGLSFIIGLVLIIYNFLKYIWHPVSYGRTGGLSTGIEHIERLLIGGALGLWLAMFVIALLIIYGQTGALNVNTAMSVAGQLFEQMFYEVAYVLSQATGIKLVIMA